MLYRNEAMDILLASFNCFNLIRFSPWNSLLHCTVLYLYIYIALDALYCIVSIHLYSARCIAHQSEALPVRETQREERSDLRDLNVSSATVSKVQSRASLHWFQLSGKAG